MEELAEHGYLAVRLRDLYEHWRCGRSLPPKPVVISFDDGYRNVYSDALPVLQALGWPAVLYLHLGMLTRPSGVGPAMVREMIEGGWEVESHTLTHPHLTRLSRAALRSELSTSRKMIQSLFGVRGDFFCYPSGRYDARVVAAVRAAGYLAATTTRPGLASADELFSLRRVRVDGGDSADDVRRRLDDLLSNRSDGWRPS
jgi:peptidoglycan/xylan/chitin deacetylase (PgdA/CDA1 family)